MKMAENLDISAGQKILLLWSGNQAVEKLQQVVEELKAKVGETGKVQVENIERLALCKLHIMIFIRIGFDFNCLFKEILRDMFKN